MAIPLPGLWVSLNPRVLEARQSPPVPTVLQQLVVSSPVSWMKLLPAELYPCLWVKHKGYPKSLRVWITLFPPSRGRQQDNALWSCLQ